MGVDAASGWVLDEIEDNKPIPKASRIEDIHPEEGGFVSLLVLDKVPCEKRAIYTAKTLW